MADHLGSYNTSSNRTHVRFQFTTHAGTGAAVAPNSAFENSDLRLYKATDGAAFSATQRSSSNGITMTSPFDSVTGLHDVDIDLTDNTDASFYVAGFYAVVLVPDETVDSVAVVRVLAYFEIGPPPANVTQIAGSAVSTSTAQLGVNAVQAGGTAWGSGAITAASIASDAITAAKVADGTIDAATFATGAITAAAIATGAIDADAVATDAVTEIQSGLSTLDAAGVRTAVGLGSANLDTQLGDLPTNAELATALGTADDAVLAAIAALNNLSQANIRTAVGLGSANLETLLTTIDDFLDTEVSAIKAKTDSLTFTAAGQVDANVQRINDVTITGDGDGTPFGV